MYESQIGELQQQLEAAQNQREDADEIAQNKVSRLCVIALPHAVAKLHDLVYREVRLCLQKNLSASPYLYCTSQ